MKKISAAIAASLAFAAIPSGSIAQPAPAVWLGVAFTPQDRGVKVAEIAPGGPGDRMGVRPGDLITHAGGKRINSLIKLKVFLRTLKPGDPVELTVKRKGETLELKGTADARPS